MSVPGWLGRALAIAALLATGGCDSVCPSGTDERADPGGDACTHDDQCLVRCACYDEATDDELEIHVGECVGGICDGAEDLCEDGCGSLELVAYCRSRG